MTTDEQHIRRALHLARAGIGLVSPNPAVGAVVVDSSGREVGAGTHTYDNLKHAEVLALEQAGAAARGATLYLNLEPCSHQGRTGPCVDAVLAAGIARVVCSMQDPNPRVAGQGFAKLRAAGIKVDLGLFEAEARKLNESFAKYIQKGKPLVTLKSAMTLDGKIADATKPGDEPGARTPATEGSHSGYHWITGEVAREHVQQLRHQHDAILAGVGTVMADDPLLTDRTGQPRRRKLLRVILDSYLRIPPDSRVVQTADNDVLVMYSTADEQTRKALEEKGIRLQAIAATADGRPDFPAIVQSLGEQQITSLLIEGGSLVNGAALASGEVDKVFLYYAPKIFGEGAVPFIAGERHGRTQCLQRFVLHRFGEDFAVEGYLRDPYAKEV
ncbi:MAG TPA: bifunctional diaminohydroxyphosphoribosylaminopyrimidine deaminase/5-amino-6-(5-phosphoribosylamino)uracil reductase RibD [Terriglobales bacterium]|jgi:diaminohydroxyphosphoribosylaminopyrimidine deaminase/5-amino-6-(5-phosphoribosylamino)uracil reductase|nr:bifunctional diaminohydroxyphosphoribosylaminopyrimidine deaminase/5-amino-6-(5-phosphoribosylamino)uracil reductase RibD [Terriglobales bacterium]